MQPKPHCISSADMFRHCHFHMRAQTGHALKGHQGLVTADRMSRRRPRSGPFPQQISHSVMPQLQADMARHVVPMDDVKRPQLAELLSIAIHSYRDLAPSSQVDCMESVKVISQEKHVLLSDICLRESSGASQSMQALRLQRHPDLLIGRGAGLGQGQAGGALAGCPT